MAKQSEILELLLRVSGGDDVAKLRGEIERLAKEGDASAQELKELVDGIDQLKEAEKAARSLDKLKSSLAQTERELDEASRSALYLKLELGSVEKPTRQMQAAFDKASRSVGELQTKQRQQTSELVRAQVALAKSGVDTSKLASETDRLQREVGESTTKLRQQATASATAAKQQDTLGRAAEKNLGVFSRLRGVFAGLIGYLSLRSAAEGVKNILSLGDAAERTQVRLSELYGSQEAGNKAFTELRTLARDNGQAFEGLLEAAAKLKAFGLEPLDGTLQSLVDQNAKLGGSQETLEGIILAVGQAWAKQKLQGEEILQLVERGVPVWDLLAKATGKNVVELQKLSEQGKLGRDVMKALLQEIGASSAGAASRNLGLLSTLLLQLRERAEQFLRTISDSGALDHFKTRVAAITTEFDRLAKNGRLAEIAKSISDFIVGTAKAAEGAVRTVVAYSGALFELAKAYVAIKFAGFLVGMAATTKAMFEAGVQARATALGVGGLKGALGAIPTNIKIAVAAVGLELAISQWTKLAERIKEAEATEREAGRVSIEVADARRNLNARMQDIIASYKQYSDAVVKTEQQVQSASQTELQAYAANLEAARKYYAALAAERRKAQDIEGAKQARAELDKYSAAIDVATKRLREMAAARDAGFTKPPSDLSLALVGLGVDAETAGIKITQEGEKLIGFFKQVATSAEATGSQIRVAFSKAVDASKTIAEVKELEKALRVAFETGKITAGEFALEAIKAEEKIRGIQEATRTAAGGFDQVGDSAEVQAKRTIAALETVRDNLVAMAHDIEAKLAAAIANGQPTKALRDELALTERSVSNVNKQIDQTRAGLASAGSDGAQDLQQVTAAANDAGAAAKDVGDKAAEGAKSGGDSFAAFISILQQLSDKFLAVSENAQAYFVRLQKDSVRASLDLNDAIRRTLEAGEATQRAIDNQQAGLEGLSATFDLVAEKGEGAGEAMARGIGRGSEELDRFAEAVRLGNSTFELLAEQDLEALAASAERAADKIRAIEDAARAAAERLAEMNRQQQDERDRAAGNEEAIAERQHQEKLRQIREAAAAAGDANSVIAQETLRLAEENHQRELARIRERKNAESGGGSSGSSRDTSSGSSAPRPGTSGGGSSAGSGALSLNLTVNGSVIGSDPTRLAEELARLLNPELKKIARRSA